jgi:hypothetical protein
MKMKSMTALRVCAMTLLLGFTQSGFQASVKAANAVLIGWSDLGIHETDGSDVSVYSPSGHQTAALWRQRHSHDRFVRLLCETTRLARGTQPDFVQNIPIS